MSVEGLPSVSFVPSSQLREALGKSLPISEIFLDPDGPRSSYATPNFSFPPGYAQGFQSFETPAPERLSQSLDRDSSLHTRVSDPIDLGSKNHFSRIREGRIESLVAYLLGKRESIDSSAAQKACCGIVAKTFQNAPDSRYPPLILASIDDLIEATIAIYQKKMPELPSFHFPETLRIRMRMGYKKEFVEECLGILNSLCKETLRNKNLSPTALCIFLLTNNLENIAALEQRRLRIEILHAFLIQAFSSSPDTDTELFQNYSEIFGLSLSILNLLDSADKKKFFAYLTPSENELSEERSNPLQPNDFRHPTSRDSDSNPNRSLPYSEKSRFQETEASPSMSPLVASAHLTSSIGLPRFSKISDSEFENQNGFLREGHIENLVAQLMKKSQEAPFLSASAKHEFAKKKFLGIMEKSFEESPDSGYPKFMLASIDDLIAATKAIYKKNLKSLGFFKLPESFQTYKIILSRKEFLEDCIQILNSSARESLAKKNLVPMVLLIFALTKDISNISATQRQKLRIEILQGFLNQTFVNTPIEAELLDFKGEIISLSLSMLGLFFNIECKKVSFSNPLPVFPQKNSSKCCSSCALL